jgi:hypothetical protein
MNGLLLEFSNLFFLAGRASCGGTKITNIVSRAPQGNLWEWSSAQSKNARIHLDLFFKPVNKLQWMKVDK